MDAEIFVSQHLHLDTPLTAKPLSWCYQVKEKWFAVKDWHSTGSVAMDSSVFVATLLLSQNLYWHSTGSVATNTALSVDTVATNKHFLLFFIVCFLFPVCSSLSPPLCSFIALSPMYVVNPRQLLHTLSARVMGQRSDRCFGDICVLTLF